MQDKLLVFTATNGRSGTQYLAEILKCIPGVYSTHEEKPLFSDQLSRIRKNRNLVAPFVTRKIEAIYKNIKESVYVETAHLAGKGFLEELHRQHPNMLIICLYRDKRKVAMSMYKLGDIPGRTKTGLHWYLTPDDWMSLTMLKRSYKKYYSDYQMCYWQTLETDKRIMDVLDSAYKPSIFITIEELSNIYAARVLVQEIQRVANLHQVFTMQPPEFDRETYNYVITQRYNLKISRKLRVRAQAIPDHYLDEAEAEMLSDLVIKT